MTKLIVAFRNFANAPKSVWNNDDDDTNNNNNNNNNLIIKKSKLKLVSNIKRETFPFL